MDKTMDEKEEVRAWMTELVGSGLEEDDVSMVMDVEQAEVLLDRHWETSMEVGCLVKCPLSSVQCASFGGQCSACSVHFDLKYDMYSVHCCVKVDDCLESLREVGLEGEASLLEALCQERRELYEQCWVLQKFLQVHYTVYSAQ